MMPRTAGRPSLAVEISTLALALLFALLPFAGAPFVPDFLALFIAFWVLHDPSRIGMFTAFCLGFLLDACSSPVFGTHALSYTVLAYGTLLMRSRLLWVPIGIQGLYMLPIFAVSKLALLAVSLWFWGTLPDLLWWCSPILTEAFAWPFIGIVYEWASKGKPRKAPL